MYPSSKAADSYPTAATPPSMGIPAAAPPPSMGIPAASANQYYTHTAPPPLLLQSQGVPTPWSTGLCQCYDNVGNCCITCFCPCITFGQIAEIVDRGSSSCGTSGALYTLIMCVTGCPCVYSCFYRAKLRRQFTLPEGACPDCLVHCCCESCALCQEYRELKNRGFDMKIGWLANMEKQSRAGAATEPPSVADGMTR